MKAMFLASNAPGAQQAKSELEERYGRIDPDQAEVIVAIGGDGFMLDVLKSDRGLPVYGVNRGTVGFLMNDPDFDDLEETLARAEPQDVPLLRVEVFEGDQVRTALAVNDVALLRSGPQAANLDIVVNEEPRMERLICDGVLVATPAGSTAYNASLGGPILPVDANVLALTPMAPFRPRRWRGAVLPMSAHIEIRIDDKSKRPVGVSADGADLGQADKVRVYMAGRGYKVLFDPGHSLERRILDEQFC